MKRIVFCISLVLVALDAMGWKYSKISSIAEVDRAAEKLKAEILSAKSNYRAQGTVWYVSNDGDDQNDGRSPETALRTLDKVNSLPLKSGDVVLFRRGDLWRGHIKTRDGATYSAYGKGEKPRIYGSPFDAAKTGEWKLTDAPDVYALSIPLKDDVGTLVFDDSSCAIKITGMPTLDGRVLNIVSGEPFTGYRDLDNDLEFYHDLSSGIVYLCSKNGAPASRFGSIEVLTHGHCFNVRNGGATIDSFCIKYTGSHGVGAYGTVTSLTVTNCEVGWIGGSIQHPAPVPTGKKPVTRVVRYGNGIEIWGTCEHYFVDHNYVYQCYDAGVTHQWRAQAKGQNMCDVTYSRNLVEKCVYALEYFLSGPGEFELNSVMRDILVKDNIFRMSGIYGWGYQRPNKDSPAVIKAWGTHANRSENFRMVGNVIDRGYPHLLDVHAGKPEWMPVCKGNVFFQETDYPVGTEIEAGAEVLRL